MNRNTVLKYVKECYGTDPEYLWSRTPQHGILRHKTNNKWYGAVMNIPRSALGLTGVGNIDVLNVKCAPEMTYLLRQLPGILPAYHMNKEHWVTILLDGSVSKTDIFERIDESFKLTE